MTDTKIVNNLYSNALEQAKKAAENRAGNSDIANTTRASFSDVLKASLNNAVEAQHKSEAVSAAAVAGKANITDVLQAVTEAEMTLNTVVAIRDKVISAYEQIMRSPI